MRSAAAIVLGAVLAVAVAGAQAGAELVTVPPPQAQPAPPAATNFKVEQLDQLMAPIALYPDALLAQILAASTYPLEIVMAARWAADPNNAALTGEALAQALQAQSWDPSVKSLVPFAGVLKMLSDRIEWTKTLGDAFLAQPQDCFASIQRLRQLAQSAGKLASIPGQDVTAQGPDIALAPANPDIVYVPVYDPADVYGGWPYPAYPPDYWAGPLGFGLGFGSVVVIVNRKLWGWCNPNWRHGTIAVNADRFNRINVHHPAIGLPIWRHDPAHRDGVPYPTAATRQEFGRQPTGAAAPAILRVLQTGTGADAAPATTVLHGNTAAAMPRAVFAAARPMAGHAATSLPTPRCAPRRAGG